MAAGEAQNRVVMVNRFFCCTRVKKKEYEPHAVRYRMHVPLASVRALLASSCDLSHERSMLHDLHSFQYNSYAIIIFIW